MILSAPGRRFLDDLGTGRLRPLRVLHGTDPLLPPFPRRGSPGQSSRGRRESGFGSGNTSPRHRSSHWSCFQEFLPSQVPPRTLVSWSGSDSPVRPQTPVGPRDSTSILYPLVSPSGTPRPPRRTGPRGPLTPHPKRSPPEDLDTVVRGVSGDSLGRHRSEYLQTRPNFDSPRRRTSRPTDPVKEG